MPLLWTNSIKISANMWVEFACFNFVVKLQRKNLDFTFAWLTLATWFFFFGYVSGCHTLFNKTSSRQCNICHSLMTPKFKCQKCNIAWCKMQTYVDQSVNGFAPTTSRSFKWNLPHSSTHWRTKLNLYISDWLATTTAN